MFYASLQAAEQSCHTGAFALAADGALRQSELPSWHSHLFLTEQLMRSPPPSTSWDHLWCRLIGPLHPDVVRPEDDDALSLEAARQRAWEEGWPKFSWHGCVHPTRRTRKGRQVPQASVETL